MGGLDRLLLLLLLAADAPARALQAAYAASYCLFLGLLGALDLDGAKVRRPTAAPGSASSSLLLAPSSSLSN